MPVGPHFRSTGWNGFVRKEDRLEQRGSAPRKAEKAEKAGKAEKACGGNNSPRTPLIPPCGCAAAAGQGEREDDAQGKG